MNFYVPVPQLNEKADLLLLMMEERLAACGRSVTRRRIRALIWDDGEQEECILVGASFHDCQDGSCPVLLILEDAGEQDLVHVVTLADAGMDEMPRMIRLDPLWRIVDFDDSAGDDGCARRVRV
jgi:hypothetical protein